MIRATNAINRTFVRPRLLTTPKYSRASDNGPSEKRTTSLQQTSVVLRIAFSIVVILTQPPRSGCFLFPDSGHDSGSHMTCQCKFASKYNNGHSETTPSKLYHAHNIQHVMHARLMCVCGDDWDTAFLADEQPVVDGGSVVRMMLLLPVTKGPTPFPG